MGGVQVVLGAVLHVLHRTPQLLREPEHHRVIEVHENLGAEPAANIWRDDPHLLLRHAQDEGCHQQLVHVRRLGGCPEGVLLGTSVVLPDRAACFHGGRDQALVGQRLGDAHF